MSQVSLPVGINFLLQAVPLSVSDSVAQGAVLHEIVAPSTLYWWRVLCTRGVGSVGVHPVRRGTPILDVGRHVGARSSGTDRYCKPASWPSSWVFAGG